MLIRYLNQLENFITVLNNQQSLALFFISSCFQDPTTLVSANMTCPG